MWSRRRFLEIVSGVPFLGRSAAAYALSASAPEEASRSFLSAGAPVVAAGARGFSRAAPPSAPRDYFRELGVRPFINAAGTYTAMTASLMPPQVIEAMTYASKQYVMLDELHDRVGARIATLLHCESAMVTSGAASALTLGTAAVLTGTDARKIVELPNLAGMKSEVIIQKAHRFGYDHAVRNCGVRLVEVETRDEMERAIGPQTAMMLFYNNNNSEGRIRDEEFVQIARTHGVPTLNDAAADVPPVDNLWKYTRMGFDLVAFSGGKGLRGPQSAGLLLGRKDLIAAARLNAPPNGNTVGRGLKVNKEEMVGMLAALELYLAKDHAAEQREFEGRADTIRNSAAAVAGVNAEVFVPEVANHVPHVRISWDAAAKGLTPADAVKKLRAGEPSIGTRTEGDAVVIGVWMMRPGEEKIVARRLRDVLENRG
jgi:L-seryl-tRNA(Ser) seleniumtransferase